jgi:twitching motility protein PilT
MRQDPDVIMVGEMRDLETISTAITAAETGHLVFSTLHTNSANQTIDRIIDSFPADQQHQIRSQLSLVLRAIVSMKLVEGNDGRGLMPVLEIMINSPKISKHIELNEIKEIHEEIANSVNFYRMQTLNQSLIAMLAHNVIDYDQAIRVSNDPDDLSLKLRKMFPNIEEKFREGDMAPSPADFSQITELLEIKRVYEELEERHRAKLQEKDEQIAMLEAEITDLRSEIDEQTGTSGDMNRELEQAKAAAQRVREESQQKIAQLNERIRELNQRLQDGGGRPSTGFFKR